MGRRHVSRRSRGSPATKIKLSSDLAIEVSFLKIQECLLDEMPEAWRASDGSLISFFRAAETPSLRALMPAYGDKARSSEAEPAAAASGINPRRV